MNRRDFLTGSTLALAAGCRTRAARHAPLRVMTYNLHHGEGIDGRLDLERIAAVIRGAAPDLVALQEVDRVAQRTGGVDQAAAHAQLTGLHGWFGAAMPFEGGEYGQVLLSRWPLVRPRVVRLPGDRAHEPRIAVAAEVEVPTLGSLRWAGVHLDASRTDDDRWEQVGALVREFGGDDPPILLAGDFNASPDSRVMRRMLEPAGSWEDLGERNATPTSPADAPRSRIDYILARPRDRWRVEEFVVLSEAVASDHRPVLAVLRWQD